jgi:endoglucanase
MDFDFQLLKKLCETPGAPGREERIRAIVIDTLAPLCHSFLRQIAAEREIPYPMEVLTRGGTDTAALQRSGKGAAAGCISIPTRYVHSAIEMCRKEDIRAAIDLLATFIENAHRESFAL